MIPIIYTDNEADYKRPIITDIFIENFVITLKNYQLSL